MPEPIIPLRTDHAFMLQLQESHDCPESCRAGRVEHLATGKATRFTTTTELWFFVDRVRAPNGHSGKGARRLVAKRVKELLEEGYREAVHLEDLCRATGVGVRTLQRSFREYFDLTITDHLKAVRLDAAHRELSTVHPAEESVTTIASRHGITHMGRFSVEYRERFGESPRDTLARRQARSHPAEHRSGSVPFGLRRGWTDSP
jgi:transcriptional regulator GlxA family with amidase domain